MKGFPFTTVAALKAGVVGVFFTPILYYVIATIPLLLSIWERADITLDETLHPPGEEGVYDFIIVGAGSAGSVLANRLSKHYTVLLLEYGGEPNPLTAIPAFSVFLINYPETDWSHKSVPQCCGSLNSIDQRSSWSAGKGLGGTGNINLLLYLRGNPEDFNNWSRMTRDSSWSYEGVLPYFKNMEKYADPKGDPRYHGFNGDLSIELPAFTGIGDEFVQAGGELGYPHIDINAPHTEGFFKLYHTTKNGVRSAPFRDFIVPARSRKTLTIRKYAHVNKILFRENNQEVYGVEYIRHGKTLRATVTKEVIISAGTINTPKLLMLSGIGPRDHLEKHGIPVRHNLPVGKNLQDHTAVYLGPFFIDQPRTVYLDRDVNPKAFVEWFAGGQGKLSSSGAIASGVFSSSFAKERGEGDWPDTQLYLFDFTVFKTFPDVFSQAFHVKLDEMKQYYKHAIDKESFLIIVSGARPFSKGEIRLGGPSAYDSPEIDPNYLNDKDNIDVKVLIEGTKKALTLVENTTTFDRLGGKFTNEKLPGCEHLIFRSDEYWECFVRRYTVTLHHFCGTASMGPLGSPDAVVDPELRVQGIKNLRVVDASIMPTVVVVNTQAATMMIAEKAADMIIRHWKWHTNEI